MLQITPRAIDHLQHLRTRRGLADDVGVRFVRNGARVGLTFAPAPESDDRVDARAGMRVYLSPEVVEVFDRSIVDARTDAGRTWLVLRPQSDRKAPRPT
jgi:Fe-S cluster assembly iron-binding protein IscA